MGVLRRPARVKLFCALLVAADFPVECCEAGLQKLFGPIVLRSEPVPFTQTTYYDNEMGPGLRRLYVAFDALYDMADLPAIKHRTNALEADWAVAPGRRRVNIDPGYLDLAKVVLASTKDHAHRLYVGAGIYAEVTLRYWHKQFQPWDWTYPDYRLPLTRAFFERLRELYKAQVSAET